MADENGTFVDDEMDSGVSDFHRLEPRVGDEPEEVFSPDGGEDGRARGGEDGASTPPSSPDEPDVWAGFDPELASLAQNKGWKTPEDALRGYQGLEAVMGRQNTERDEERRAAQRERELLLAQLQQGAPQRPEPVQQEALPIVEQIDWTKFGDLVGGDGEAFEAYTRAVFPLLQEEAMNKVRAEFEGQLAPAREHAEQQQLEAAWQSEFEQVAAMNPDVWEMTRDRTFDILRGWEEAGNALQPGHIRHAQHQAMVELFNNAAQQQQVQTPALPAGQQAANDGAAVTPPAQQQQPVATGDLRPLSSTTVAQEPRDVNAEIREAIRNAIPRHDGSDI